MTKNRNQPNQISAKRRVATQPKLRMIGIKELPTVTKAEFIYLVYERGVWLRPRDVKYVRFIDGQFWFILLGSADQHTTEPGCASSWAAVTDDGNVNYCFEIDDERPIDQTPLKDVIPIGSKLRMKRKAS